LSIIFTSINFETCNIFSKRYRYHTSGEEDGLYCNLRAITSDGVSGILLSGYEGDVCGVSSLWNRGPKMPTRDGGRQCIALIADSLGYALTSCEVDGVVCEITYLDPFNVLAVDRAISYVIFFRLGELRDTNV